MRDREIEEFTLSLIDGTMGNEADALGHPDNNHTLFIVRALNHLTESVLFLSRVINEKPMHSGL